MSIRTQIHRSTRGVSHLMHYGGQGNWGRIWLLFPVHTASIHCQQWDNAIYALCGSMAHIEPERGKKTGYQSLSEIRFVRVFVCLWVCVYFFGPCIGLCESWFDSLHTVSPSARTPLKKQYLLTVGLTCNRHRDASGGCQLSNTYSVCVCVQLRTCATVDHILEVHWSCKP